MQESEEQSHVVSELWPTVPEVTWGQLAGVSKAFIRHLYSVPYAPLSSNLPPDLTCCSINALDYTFYLFPGQRAGIGS